MAELLSVSFTASRDLDDPMARSMITAVLVAEVPYADRYFTGGATGGDAFIGRWLYENRPGAEHWVVIPANKSQVSPWYLTVTGPAVRVIAMPHGSTYADRNAVLVRRGTMMFGFPAYPEDDPRSLRSGSWQALRMARKARKLSQWQCVKAPYTGKIEMPASEFMSGRDKNGSEEER